MGIFVLAACGLAAVAGGAWIVLEFLDQHRYIQAVSRARLRLWPVPPEQDDSRRA